MTGTQIEERHINETAAAIFLGVKVTTLRDWRFRKRGPNYAQFGRAVRYPIHGLEQYAAQSTVQPQ